MELTTRQREIFDFVKIFIKERGYPPSIREIGQKFNIYPRAVFDHLKALERKGYLKRRGSMSRSIEVLVKDSSELGVRGSEFGVQETADSGDSCSGQGCRREARLSRRTCGGNPSASCGMDKGERGLSSQGEGRQHVPFHPPR